MQDRGKKAGPIESLPRVLIVEDEEAIARLISVNLRHNGFEPAWANDAQAAQREVDKAMPDVVLMDWMLPGESGFSLLKRWRDSARTRQLPILMVSARAEEAEMVAALDAGADDYLTKPFSISELMARIRAILRRRGSIQGQDAISVGQLVLDPATHRVSYGPLPLKLGPLEFRMLHFLMQHPAQIHSRRQLLDGVCGEDVHFRERAIDVHVNGFGAHWGRPVPWWRRSRAPVTVLPTPRPCNSGPYAFSGRVWSQE